MPLTEDDLQAVGRLLDAKLDQFRRIERRRRMHWLLFWTLLGLISLAASAWSAHALIRGFQDVAATQQREWGQAKLEYQRELAKDRAMRDERDRATANAGYDATKSQAQYEAKLLRSLFSTFNRQAEIKRKLKEDDSDDIESLIANAEDMSSTLNDSLGVLMQVLLRNTDPEHNTPGEKLQLGGESVPPSAPLIEADNEADKREPTPQSR